MAAYDRSLLNNTLLGLISASVFLLVMGSLVSSGNRFPVEGKTVLVTGGSQGMGKAVATLLSRKGANVVIVARNRSRLEQALRGISAVAQHPGSQRFHLISADVTSPQENERIILEATAWNHGAPPDIVWAIAGSAQPTLFLEASIETLQSQMDINYWSAAYLAYASLRIWLYPRLSLKGSERGDDQLEVIPRPSRENPPVPRHLIMTSSTSAFVGVAGYSPYSPPKAAMRSLHDQLKCELNIYHGALAAQRDETKNPDAEQSPEIKLHIVFPGTILSPGYESENKVKHPVTKLLEEDDENQTEDQVAAAAVAELEKGRSLITTQRFQGAAMKASSLMGSPRDRPLVDTIFSWLMAVVWLFVSWDMERKVWKWGFRNGFPKLSDRT